MDDWNQLFTQHADAVWRTAYRIVGNTADADDTMQDVFVEAVGMNGSTKVRNWSALLRRLTTVRALDRLRRHIREKNKSSNWIDWDSLPSTDASPDAKFARGELSWRLRWALSCLPEQQAEAFCLRHVEDMSYEDIAGQLMVSVNSIGVILHRARERLRELLQESAALKR